VKTDPQAAPALPAIPWRRAPLVLLLLAAAILAITWPWARTFASAVLDHWDPPFHAWKLEYVARAILAGHLLPPDGNTNMYYPYPGTLYFEALHWPQALVAAPLFALPGANPVLIYHVVLVFFWALSGLCFWLLLLALGATRRAALLGALLFTLMPYRISYALEFNMQLCFGVPLFFFFLVRYFQRPAIRYACGMALAWWLQASSELYQAIFLLLILPFPGLALIASRWRLLRDFRRFWLPVGCAATLGGALTYVLLGPYLTLLNVHMVNRNLLEIATHVLEPLSYLRPGGRFHVLAPFDARRDEMIVYPTVAMILLTVLHLLFDARRLLCVAVPRWVQAFRILRWSALIAFFVLTFGIYFIGAPAWIGPLYALLPVVAVAAAVAVLFHPTERDPAVLFATGLFAGAIFAFFMSMGPLLAIRHAGFFVPNRLYLWIYGHLAALQGFRVVSRFSIYLLIFMALASGLAWSHVERRWLRRPALRWLWLVPLLLAVPECLPKGIRVKPLECPFSTAVLERLDRRREPYVLAMLPMGDRARDSSYMLRIARTDRLFVYAWGGAYPHYTRQVRDSLDPRAFRPTEAAELLRQLWPECLLLEDKSVTRKARRAKVPLNYVRGFGAETELVDEDERFALLRLKPKAEPAVEQIRQIRRDFLAANPRLAFVARVPAGAPPATLWLDVNGYPAGRWEIADAPQEFQIDVAPRQLIGLLPNRLRFHAENDAPFFLDSFRAVPAPGAAPALDEALAAAPLPWLGHLVELPTNAIPFAVHYRNGFAYLGCEPLATNVPPGGVFRLRHYVRSPRHLDAAVGTSIRTHLRAPDGRWMEEGVTLESNDLHDVECQIRPGIYALDQAIPMPDRFGPGDYELSLVLRDPHGQRLVARQDGRIGKAFPLPFALRIQAPAGP